MSRTTDIILAVGVCDEERLEEFQKAMEAAGFEPSFNTPHLGNMRPWVEKEVPGRKVYTDGVWMACWNFGDLEALQTAFMSFDWDRPENAVLLYADEQRETQVFRPKP